MPIQTAGLGSYQPIPGDEDVSYIDGTIAKESKKSARCFYVGIGLLFLCSILLIYGFIKYIEQIHESVQIYQTSKGRFAGMELLTIKDMHDLRSQVGSISFGNIQCEGNMNCDNVGSTPAKLVVDPTKPFQNIVGFGGAFTESSAINFFQLPPLVQKNVIEAYFGASGIGLSLGRIHINSCDFSTKSYSFDDIDKDYELLYFDTEVTHDNAAIIPFIRLAMEASSQPIKILASPWSPPAWMKEPVNGIKSMTGSATPNGLINTEKVKTAWANYITKFISAYSAKGIKIWAVTPQNEPEFPAPWEACAYNATYERDWVNEYLGPAIKTVHPDVLILAFDHNKDHLKSWTETMFEYSNEQGAGGYIDGMAFHWYGGMERVTDGTYGYDAVNASYHIMKQSLSKSTQSKKEKFLIASEGCSCPDVRLNDWLRAERLSHDIMYDLMNYAQGWIDWNLLVDWHGGPNHLNNMCDASFITLPDFSNVYTQPKYFYFGHISKYVKQNSVRIHSSIVGNYAYELIDPNIQAGVETGLFPCERSARQLWTLLKDGSIQLSMSALDEDATPPSSPSVEPRIVELCIANGDMVMRSYLKLIYCGFTNDTLKFDFSNSGQFIERESQSCLGLAGVDISEPGVLLELQPCIPTLIRDDNRLNRQLFQYHAIDTATSLSIGEIISHVDGLCLTAGWPFLSTVAFRTSEKVKQTVIVVMNEAAVSTTIVYKDNSRKDYLGFGIDARSIQTIVY